MPNMEKRDVYGRAVSERMYRNHVQSMRIMLVEADGAELAGDLELCSMLQASVTAMAHSIAKRYGRGFYEVMADVNGTEA